MFETIWQIIIHTPWWVYLLFAYLIFIGIKASKSRVTPFLKLLIAPIIFSWMSIDTLVGDVGSSSYANSIWAIAILIGVFFGWLQLRLLKIQTDRKRLLIKMPGSWITLILILIIFFSKYYFGYSSAVQPSLLENTGYVFIMLAISGVCTGLFIGRVIRLVQLLLFAPQISLAKPTTKQ